MTDTNIKAGFSGRQDDLYQNNGSLQRRDFGKFVQFFRMSSSYIAGHRSNLFVVCLPGEVSLCKPANNNLKYLARKTSDLLRGIHRYCLRAEDLPILIGMLHFATAIADNERFEILLGLSAVCSILLGTSVRCCLISKLLQIVEDHRLIKTILQDIALLNGKPQHKSIMTPFSASL